MPHSWKRLSLARQLFLAMLAPVAVVTSAYFAYDVRATNRRLEEMERSTMESVFPIVQRIIEDAMVHKSREHVRDLFTAASNRGVAEAMYLLDETKHAVDLDDLADGRPPRRFRPPEFPGKTHLIADFPMVSRPSCLRCHGEQQPVIGYVRIVSQHAQKAQAIAANVSNHVIVLSFMAFVLGVWALLVVRAMVERPLQRIETAMRHVSAGRFETRVEGPFDGEFGRISEGFNAMVAELSEDRRKILDLHRRQVAHMERLVAVGELAANLAHEIRNPLTGISSAIQVLQAETPAASPKREVLEKILAQLTRMDQTMGNFLRFARMPQAQLRPFHLSEALSRTLFLVEPRLKAQGIELRTSIDSSLPRLAGDPGQIEQALLNLCLNAVQAMPKGGRLTVNAYRQNGEVRLDLTDEGCGIPPEQLDRIFQPFFTTRENGSGLGLPITRQIVLSHGGELWLESVPGRGTTVHIRLPIARNGD